MVSTPRAARQRRFVTRAGQEVFFTEMGFGSAPLGNYLRQLPENECDAVLEEVWRTGLRYFDTAPFYGLGLSEQRVGRQLRKRERSSFTLSTKVGRLLLPCRPEEVNSLFFVNTPQVQWIYDYSYDAVMRSYEESCKRIGVNRVDILFVHDVDGFCHGGREGSERAIQGLINQGGWRALTELRSSGAVGAIGAGVNEWQPCARLLELLDPDLFLLAGRYTLLEQEPLEQFFPECERRGVGVVIGGPYNSGILAGGATYNYSAAPTAVVERVQAIGAVCREYGVPLNAAALQFVLAHPVVLSVIPGSQTLSELQQNIAALEVPISAEFWTALKRKALLHEGAPVPHET